MEEELSFKNLLKMNYGNINKKKKLLCSALGLLVGVIWFPQVTPDHCFQDRNWIPF